MNKDLKSILTSFSIILLYFYATVGVVSILSKDKKGYLNNNNINNLFASLMVGTLFFMIVPYHMFGPGGVETLYKAIIIFHLAYLIVGCYAHSLIKEKL